VIAIVLDVSVHPRIRIDWSNWYPAVLLLLVLSLLAVFLLLLALLVPIKQTGLSPQKVCSGIFP